MARPKLEPCRRCALDPRFSVYGGNSVTVECRACLFSSGLCETKSEAARRWNAAQQRAREGARG
jgi:hypothetical protein